METPDKQIDIKTFLEGRTIKLASLDKGPCLDLLFIDGSSIQLIADAPTEDAWIEYFPWIEEEEFDTEPEIG